MDTITMIKRLSENRSDTYKQVLICEFLQDINYHKEAWIVRSKIRSYWFLTALDLLARETNFDKKHWDYLNKDYDLKKYMWALHTLMTEEWNFRVATNPMDKYDTVWYDKFRDFQAANRDYSVVSNLAWWGIYDWEAEELINFAFQD